MSLETWIPFAFATLAFACMPGPAILYMSARTLAYGHRAGLMAAPGVHLGCHVHIAASTVGRHRVLRLLAGLVGRLPRPGLEAGGIVLVGLSVAIMVRSV